MDFFPFSKHNRPGVRPSLSAAQAHVFRRLFGLAILLLILIPRPSAGQGAAGRIEVFHRGGETGMVRAVKTKAALILERLQADFGLSVNVGIKIILASSREEFDAAQPYGARLPTWAAGVAYPKENLIIIKSRRAIPNLDLDRVLAHELAHLALGRVFGDYSVPLWLNEGLTMHLADDWGVDRQLAMLRAISHDRLIPLDDLVAGFPEDSLDAKTAYAQSYYLVAFLRDRWGAEVAGRLIRHLGAGVAAEYALNRATGLRMWELEDDFQVWLNRRFSIFWILTGPYTLWTLAVLLLAAAYVIRKRAAAKKMAEWEAEEDESEIDSPGP